MTVVSSCCRPRSMLSRSAWMGTLLKPEPTESAISESPTAGDLLLATDAPDDAGAETADRYEWQAMMAKRVSHWSASASGSGLPAYRLLVRRIEAVAALWGARRSATGAGLLCERGLEVGQHAELGEEPPRTLSPRMRMSLLRVIVQPGATVPQAS
jgi:hypothetical protein